MSNTIAYLTSRANFRQVSPDIPITKQRNPDKFDAPDIFEGALLTGIRHLYTLILAATQANQKEMVTDLIVKAKQVEYLINSLPGPEAEEEQVSFLPSESAYSF